MAMRRTAIRLCSPTYDYVIVGAGSAGCVLAEELSRDENVKVCLLEAGPTDTSEFIRMPLGVGVLLPTWGKEGKWRLTQEKLNWGFESTDNLKKIFQPRGRCLGGSSSINAMLYVRGNKKDYNTWEALGNRGWGWEECLEVFKSQEKFNAESDYVSGSPDFHGSSGKLNVSGKNMHDNFHELNNKFIEASKEVGHTFVKDYNTGDNTGVFWYQKSSHEGERWSSSKAFLAPSMNRKNLTVMTGCQTTRLLSDGTTFNGVEYIKVSGKGKPISRSTEKVSAGRVIVSGGAIQSPQILMLSGVGPKGHLQDMGIECVVDNPNVGENLIDHADVGMTDLMKSNTGVADGTGLLSRLPGNIMQYYQTYRGADAATRVKSHWAHFPVEVGGFARSSPDQDVPDIQFHFLPLKALDHGREPVKDIGYQLKTCLLYPNSRGSLKLKSKDPLAYPTFTMNFMNDEQDIEVMSKGIKMASDIMDASVFDDVRLRRDFPSKEVVADKDLLRTYLKEKSDTIYHPAGTCKMGSDDTAVVNDRLQVHGANNLYVIDASIYPSMIGGNTNAPTMMLAGRAAKFLQSV
eukprot:TRINITY_DN2560_c0_g1_i1.p1 TRINITY_DN2560_c0_g1~~TRINITY_DN2560_c0_g1_i1.p1  ORF type:complete len:574 (+),score=109.23 TRINITY_DN2560_c0_g1_i1:1086-2807(+)